MKKIQMKKAIFLGFVGAYVMVINSVFAQGVKLALSLEIIRCPNNIGLDITAAGWQGTGHRIPGDPVAIIDNNTLICKYGPLFEGAPSYYPTIYLSNRSKCRVGADNKSFSCPRSSL
jgi:hypothetical protein